MRHPLDDVLIAALPAFGVYAVGGRVRDEVRSELDGVPRPAKDLDYVAVGLDLAELVRRLETVGRADVVGAAFSVVKCTLDGVTVDVALPRRERSSGPGHREFIVEAGPAVSLEDDLARRDFRMNMLARTLPAGELVDPYDGEADIRARRIDILRPEAFEEDPLRMLRACQFAARFEYDVTPATMAAMRAAAHLAPTISADRVRDELGKLLELAPRPSAGFELMRQAGLLERLLPEVAEGIGVEQNEYHAYDVYRHSLATLDATPPGDLVLRLAALLHDVAKPRTKDGPHFYRHEIVGEELAREILPRLRFSSDEVEAVAGLVRHHMYAADPELSAATIRRFIRRVGKENLQRQFALRAADVVGSGLPKRGEHNEQFQRRVAEIVDERPPLSVLDLAIGGDEVIAEAIRAGKLPAGSRGGPLVGDALQRLLEQVTDDPARNERAQLLAAVREMLLPDTRI